MQATPKAVAVGFGISTAEQVKQVLVTVDLIVDALEIFNEMMF